MSTGAGLRTVEPDWLGILDGDCEGSAEGLWGRGNKAGEETASEGMAGIGEGRLSDSV